MLQTVYVDLLFLVNFSMDFLCIILMSKITFRKLLLWRAFLAATIGGLYSVLLIFTPISGVIGIAANILCCFTICLVAFSSRGESFSVLLTHCLTYFLSSVFLGGITTAAFNLLNNSGINTDSLEGEDFPPLMTLSLGVCSVITTYLGGRLIKRRSCKQTAKITLTLSDKTLTLMGLYDSGNLLRDNISGAPVVVIDKKYTKYFFGKLKNFDLDSLTALPPRIAPKIVLIPYLTVGGSKTMIAFRPQTLTITSREKVKSANALIGFANVKLSVDGCTALIPTELM